MSQIRWYDVPEARQLASLGKKLSKSAQTRLQWMLFYYFNGRNVARTCRHLASSRQTFDRWKRRFDHQDLRTIEEHSHGPKKVRRPTWSVALAERVLALRQQCPRWGKDKLVVLLCRELRTVSTSMVGRILTHLKRRGTLHEPAKPSVLRQARRKLRYRPWAVRKPKHCPSSSPGIGWRSIARRFMRLPFPVRALQVDGGSEFAAEFERACQQKELPLFVLPPKSPKLNGHVERSHRTHNEEFYQVQTQSDQLPLLNQQLRCWEKTYNCVRPHQSLAYLTPLEFINRWKLNRRKAKCH